MSIYFKGRRVGPVFIPKTIGGQNDAELFTKSGTWYDVLTDYVVQQLMTGRYLVN